MPSPTNETISTHEVHPSANPKHASIHDCNCVFHMTMTWARASAIIRKSRQLPPRSTRGPRLIGSYIEKIPHYPRYLLRECPSAPGEAATHPVAILRQRPMQLRMPAGRRRNGDGQLGSWRKSQLARWLRRKLHVTAVSSGSDNWRSAVVVRQPSLKRSMQCDWPDAAKATSVGGLLRRKLYVSCPLP